MGAVSAVVDWRLSNSLLASWRSFMEEEYEIIDLLYVFNMTARAFVALTTELAKIDSPHCA